MKIPTEERTIFWVALAVAASLFIQVVAVVALFRISNDSADAAKRVAKTVGEKIQDSQKEIQKDIKHLLEIAIELARRGGINTEDLEGGGRRNGNSPPGGGNEPGPGPKPSPKPSPSGPEPECLPEIPVIGEVCPFE